MLIKNETTAEPGRSIADVKAHVVRYNDVELILWIDRVGAQVQGILVSQDSIDETLRALTRWSMYMEPQWRSKAD
ncbi:MAG: hypothetical protein ACAI38_24755 [Myxococcota bacterium]|nr:hypothetical protein [Myxococcota bacterium]